MLLPGMAEAIKIKSAQAAVFQYIDSRIFVFECDITKVFYDKLIKNP